MWSGCSRGRASRKEEPPTSTQLRQDDENINIQAQIKAQAQAKAKADARAKAEAEALEEAQKQKAEKDIYASIGGEGDKPAPPPRPRRRGRALPARTVRTTVDGDHVRVPFTYRKEQLVILEQMKATLYARTGKWVDKSTLMREALDLLIAQFPELTGQTEPMATESEAA